MLRFSYQDEPLSGRPPPSLPATATVRWRPLLPVALVGPTGKRRLFSRALPDPGADDTVFPFALASLIAAPLHPDAGHSLRWRGQRYTLRFGDVELEISDGVDGRRWPAVVGFSSAPLGYPILGLSGCLQSFDARFLGATQAIELDANASFPGTTI